MQRLSDKKKTVVTAEPVGPEVDLREAPPRDYILWFLGLLAAARRDGIRTIKVVLYGRVSTGKQGRNGNLDHQLPYVRRRVKSIGRRYGVTIEIIAKFGEEDVSAWKFTKTVRAKLVQAARLARDNDAILVSLNTSRFVRNKRFWRNGMQPTVDDFQQLMGLVGKARLATIVRPDKPEDKPEDTVRGLAAAKARGVRLGRPQSAAGHKRKRRMQYKLPVIRLLKNGCGNREIARELTLPEKTVRDWRVRYRKYWDASFLDKYGRRTAM